MNITRVLLADDHTLVRAGLRKLLESLPHVKVVGEAPNGAMLLKLAKQLKPDLILTDIAMPELNGLYAMAELSRELPDIKVLMLSMHQNEEYVLQALENGAAGYLIKDAAPMELELAISSVLKGLTYLSPAVSKSVLKHNLKNASPSHDKGESLTPRQLEVLKLIAQGLSTKEIARNLNLSIKTIDSHRTQLMRQLDAHEVTGLVRYAIRKGLITA